ncbi:Aste57867_20387 [Aphanomyces stellatus]|uniref:Aste57867_20387 protein n=1 Tax=Aphanomyces stellatus TaxID=120398 RepID=A0A485LET5_9STRA|nr:hypothetical protein As57867_020321 [Aphanomyces stellatus]VFT97073.1 Aste57867_20387 [Aphanomyces stellatus]
MDTTHVANAIVRRRRVAARLDTTSRRPRLGKSPDLVVAMEYIPHATKHRNAVQRTVHSSGSVVGTFKHSLPHAKASHTFCYITPGQPTCNQNTNLLLFIFHATRSDLFMPPFAHDVHQPLSLVRYSAQLFKLWAKVSPHRAPAVANAQPDEPFGTLLGVYEGVALYSCLLQSHTTALDMAPSFYNGVYAGLQWQCVELARRYCFVQRGITFDAIEMANDMLPPPFFATPRPPCKCERIDMPMAGASNLSKARS